MSIKWRDIDGYDGVYQVSDCGLVRSTDREVEVFCQKKGLFRKRYVGKTLTIKALRRGYPSVTLYRDGAGRAAVIHRLVAEAFLPNPNNYPEVNHRDGDKTNNDVGNLEWCTRSENKIHAYDTGLNPKATKVEITFPNGKTKRYRSRLQASQDIGMPSSSIFVWLRGVESKSGFKARYI